MTKILRALIVCGSLCVTTLPGLGNGLCASWQRTCSEMWGEHTPGWQRCMGQPGAVQACSGANDLSLELLLPEPRPVPLPELVANQIKTGNLNCPTDESLTFEACLLYQGALGVWQNLGKPDRCPAAYSAPAHSREALSAGDVLRAPTIPCFSYIYAAQVANAVPILISTPDRAFQMLNGPFAELGSNPKLILQARHGICGEHTAVGMALLDKAGLRARPIEIYYKDRIGQRLTHIMPEVLIDGDWRPIDTTYAMYWIDGSPGAPFALRTLEQVLKPDLATKVVRNHALMPYVLDYQAELPDYLTPDADIVRGGKGEIRLSLRGAKGIENFDNIPNFIGDNVADGNYGGVSYQLIEDPGIYHVLVNVAGGTESGDQPIGICLDETCQKFSDSQSEYNFTIKNPKALRLKSSADVAYVVLKSIEWRLEKPDGKSSSD